jgi:hypothetical protein
MATSGQGGRKEAVRQLQIANWALQKLLNTETLTQIGAFPDFSDSDVTLTSQKLQSALASFVASRNAPTTPSRPGIAKRITTEWFWASYPFAQVILQIGITGSQVALRTFGFTEAVREPQPLWVIVWGTHGP